jgi:hypothetical protein
VEILLYIGYAYLGVASVVFLILLWTVYKVFDYQPHDYQPYRFLTADDTLVNSVRTIQGSNFILRNIAYLAIVVGLVVGSLMWIMLLLKSTFK